MADLSENNAAEFEAAQWVARQMGGQPFDKEGFDAWLAGDPQNKLLFDTMWDRIMGTQMRGALDSIRKQRHVRRVALAGAAILVAVGGYGSLPAVEMVLASPQDYAASDDKARVVALDDGSRLTLAGGSEARVRYTRYGRRVELVRGTLFADVTHDESRPFRIDAGNGSVTVLGTRFEVSAKPSLVRVAVESGMVRFADNGWFARPLKLTADEVGILDGSGVHRGASLDHGHVARWRDEWVSYSDAPLHEVVDDLESLSRVPIVIANNRLANLKVSGRIRLTDPDRQIANLSVIHGFSIIRSKDSIMISDGVPAHAD